MTNRVFVSVLSAAAMHFWANESADKLAKGLRAALDQVHTAKSS